MVTRQNLNNNLDSPESATPCQPCIFLAMTIYKVQHDRLLTHHWPHNRNCSCIPVLFVLSVLTDSGANARARPREEVTLISLSTLLFPSIWEHQIRQQSQDCLNVLVKC